MIRLQNLDQLLSVLYDKYVDWDDDVDVAQKCELIKQLAEV